MRANLLALAISLTAPLAAHSGDWTYSITPYVWLPGTTTSLATDRRELSVESSGSDTLSDLDFAFMGSFEARNGQWGLLTDLLYSDFSKDVETPLGRLYSGGTVQTHISALSGYVAYRFHDSGSVTADVLGGFRAYSTGIDLALQPGRLPARREHLEERWAHLLIGARVGVRLAEQWSAGLAVDVGGFDRDQDFSWQALATVNYDLNEAWSIRGGWRHLVIEKQFDAADVAVKLSGPVIGVQYRF